MAKKGKLTAYEFEESGVTYKIWSKPGALAPFVGELTPATDGGAINILVDVDGYSREQYPKQGSKVSVSASQRRRLIASPTSFKVLPGENVYFEREVSDGGKKRTQVTTATTNAPFIDVHSWASGAAASDFTLRSANGTPYPIGDGTP